MQSRQDKTHSSDSAVHTEESTQKADRSAASAKQLSAWTHAWGDRPPAALISPIAELQAKHIISQPGDSAEQEAEQVADKMMHMAAPASSMLGALPGTPGASLLLPTSMSHAQPMIQRATLEGVTDSPSTTSESAPTSSVATTEPTPITTASTAEAAPTSSTPNEIPTSGLIVEDETTILGPGQLKKSDFLAQLRSAVCTTTEEALKGTIWSAAGCPWVDHWFGYYSNRDSQQIERALRRYAPETARATTASEYIPIICERVSRAITMWSTTGKITEVPEGVPTDLSGGPSGEKAGETASVTNAGEASSSAATVSFKGLQGGAREASNPQAIQGQLGHGQSLNGGVRSSMETAFGVDFSHVRVHTDTKAAGLSESLNARAFTVGRDVAFGPGEYRPGTLVGDALIAHELAHVMQQKGATPSPTVQQSGTGNNNLEEDADTSAIDAVVSLWGGAKRMLGNIAQNALPNLRSGLRLQRCTKSSKGPISKTRLAEARTNFQSQNSQLSKAEWDKIDAALGIVVKDNLDLWIAFYDYYSNHDIAKMKEPQASKAKASGLYAITKPISDTVVRPDILEPGFPNSKLGTLLIHEFTHTRHEENVMGFGDYQEGDSYGIEYFLADRAGETSRKQEILKVMANPTKIVMASQVPALQDNFRTSYATMVALYEVIDGKPPRSAPPFTTPAPLTADEARAFVAELVAKRSKDYSTRLQDIIAWIKKHHADFDIPI